MSLIYRLLINFCHIWAQTITDMLALLISVVLYMKTNRNLRMQESSKIGYGLGINDIPMRN